MATGKAEKVLSGIQAGLLLLSAGLLIFIALANLLQPDGLAAVTLWPVWVWPLPGLGLLALAWDRRRARWILGVAAAWVLVTPALAEETRSLLRLGQPPGHDIRVVSFNCATNTEGLAEELRGLKPDIVLLQEISLPDRQARALARRIFGGRAGAACAGDCAVLARGKVTPQQSEWPYAHALVALPGRPVLHAFSAHFLPPVVRVDLWSPECWALHTHFRRSHRGQARQCAEEIARLPEGSRVIFAGDLNVRQHDASLAPLRGRLRDAFSQAGRGWGNTVLNDFPALRFDQVWVSRSLQPVSVTARKSRSSDHRMVVCDVVVR